MFIYSYVYIRSVHSCISPCPSLVLSFTFPSFPSAGDEDVSQEERYPHLTRQYGRSQTYDADDDVPPPLPPRPPDTLNYSGGESEDSDEERLGLPPPPPPNSQPPGKSLLNYSMCICTIEASGIKLHSIDSFLGLIPSFQYC